MNQAARGSLLGIEHLGAEEILGLLKLARRMNPRKPRPLLRGKRVLLLFYEASTRTRSSFEVAAKSMGAMTTLVLSSGSSIEKGDKVLTNGGIIGWVVSVSDDDVVVRIADNVKVKMVKSGIAQNLTRAPVAKITLLTAFTATP